MNPESQSPKSSGGRSWTWIIVLVLLVLIGGAIAVYLVDKNNKPSNSSTTSSTQPTKHTFAPAVNSNQPYSATITTDVNGQQKSTTMVSDGQGNYSYTYQANGQTLTTIYTPGAYYVCTSSTQCIKYTTTNANKSGFDPSTYQYDSTKLESLKNTAAYKGQQACPSGTGTCDVWAVTSANGGTASTIFVDTATKKIAKATYSSGTTSSGVTYEYKNVHIAIPTSYTNAPQ
jgi:hypothetical protein